MLCRPFDWLENMNYCSFSEQEKDFPGQEEDFPGGLNCLKLSLESQNPLMLYVVLSK